MRERGAGPPFASGALASAAALDPTGTLLPPDFVQRVERLRLDHNRRLRGGVAGERRSQRRGQSLQFADHRAYVEGDDPRQVDWNIYGRLGHLVVKQYEDEEVLTVHLLVDVSRSMDWGEPNKLAYAREIAAAFGYVTLGGHDRLFCAPVSDRTSAPFGPVWGRERAGDLVAMLRRFGAANASNLDAALASYVPRFTTPGLVVLIADLLDPTWESALRRLVARRHEVVLLHVLAPAEIAPPVGDDVRFVDRETGQMIEVHLDAVAVEQYGERFGAWTGAIERFCRTHRVTYIRVPSDASLETLFFDTLRRRGVLR